MLGLTPDPLSAGVGMHMAVAGPYTATNGSPHGRTVQTRNGRIPPGVPFRLAEHARRTAPSPACRKRPCTTHADRLTPAPQRRTAPNRRQPAASAAPTSATVVVAFAASFLTAPRSRRDRRGPDPHGQRGGLRPARVRRPADPL